MKYVCLGYYDPQKFEAMSESEQSALMEECFAYDDVLRRTGHWIGGEALQAPRNGATVRLEKGKVTVTDGPYVETKELLGGLLLLEAKDLHHAIELMSKHPGLKIGPFEVRPADETINEMIEARNRAAGVAKV